MKLPDEFCGDLARHYQGGFNWGRLRSSSELESYASNLISRAALGYRFESDRAYDAGIIAAWEERKRETLGS